VAFEPVGYRTLRQLGLDRSGLPYLVSYDLVQTSDDRDPDQNRYAKHTCDANNQSHNPFDVPHNHTLYLVTIASHPK
jgi:hypothetical protein